MDTEWYMNKLLTITYSPASGIVTCTAYNSEGKAIGDGEAYSVGGVKSLRKLSDLKTILISQSIISFYTSHRNTEGGVKSSANNDYLTGKKYGRGVLKPQRTIFT